MEILVEKYRILLQNIPDTFIRSLDEQINWQARAIGIRGARGTGKSTLMLQHIKRRLPADKTLYCSLDDLYFKQHSLSEIVDNFHKHGGKYLFLDEVHKYDDWQREVKNIYDFNPDLQIVVSGSSILALQRSEVDLSRRILWYELPELSFREYLTLKENITIQNIPLKEILDDTDKIVPEIVKKLPFPLKAFQHYLTFGAYPFFLEGEAEYLIRISQLINVIIDYDLPEARAIETVTQSKLKMLLYIISKVVPYQPNISKLAGQTNVSRSRLLEMLHLLEMAQLIYNLRSSTYGISLMNKPEKIFLRNTNLIHALAEGEANSGNLRETFFLSQLSNAGHKVTYPKVGDFLIDNKYLFEIGGKNKTAKQIKDIPHAFIAADGLVHGFGNKIPLWLFGFLY